MPISDYGEINATALIVPDVYVQIVPPQQLLIQGVPTNVIGMVGVASWGPVNRPVTVGSMADVARAELHPISLDTHLSEERPER